MKRIPSDRDWEAAGWYLGVGLAEMKAVAEVESGHLGAFLETGEPVILFEPHIFHRETRGRFADVAPGLSYPTWKSGAYGPVSSQHAKLERAAALDRQAALRSCSYGLFQVMGFNHQRAGFATIQAFVNAMYAGVEGHIRAFVAFVGYEERLVKALRAHDWTTFARLYNGSGYARHGYHTRLAAAFKRTREELT